MNTLSPVGSSLPPIGSALPPKRVAAFSVRESTRDADAVPLRESILVDTARDRLLEYFDRVLDPEDVRNILQNALHGDCAEWERLVKAMLDSWPRLQKNLNELIRDVVAADWRFLPYAELESEPTPAARRLAAQASRMLWGAKPRPTYAEGRIEDLMGWLVTGYFTGISVSEISWHRPAGQWVPRAYRAVSASHYGYDPLREGEDRLMMRRDPQAYASYEDFPEHRFVITLHGGHPGHATVSAPLRALTGFWLGAVFGLEWLMKYASLFGVPLRWATYTDENSKPEIVRMMKQIGNGAWGVGPADTRVEFVESAKSATTLPQAELLRIADEQCDLFMLGQTLTSGTPDKGGSRAQGEVHEKTKLSLVKGLCDFVGRAITDQVIPAWAFWNSGNAGKTLAELPEFFPEWPQPRDEKANAERARILAEMGLPLPLAEVYEQVGYTMPTVGQDVFLSAARAPAAP